MLAPAGVVGEVEDVLPRGGQVGADGEVFGHVASSLDAARELGIRDAQGSEVVLGCEILNRMTALGRPVSYRQVRILSVGLVRARDDSRNNAATRQRGLG